MSTFPIGRNARKSNPVLFAPQADGDDDLALIQRPPGIALRIFCACNRPIAMPVTSKWAYCTAASVLLARILRGVGRIEWRESLATAI
jgi:hypothetical protein